MDPKDEVVETQAVLTEALAEQDKFTLEMAKMNRKVALANAEKALAENNSADVSYKYIVLQLYMKYQLTEADAIDEQGNIHRNVKTEGK